MAANEILGDYPELTNEDLKAALAYAAIANPISK